jgi:tRNA threonylcarbamoyladenosine biosynthesis protein TsaB
LNRTPLEPVLLYLDTSSDICSVAVSRGSELLGSAEDIGSMRRHASLLPGMLGSLMANVGLSIHDLHGVVYSSGPGSYTGLRVGVSTAQGLCFAKNIPLISVSTLCALAYAAKSVGPIDQIIPVIDAGRQEVYYAVYDAEYNEIEAPSSWILSVGEGNWAAVSSGNYHVVGDGVEKVKALFDANPRYRFGTSKILAEYMVRPAQKKWKDKSFENLARTAPDYVKAPNYLKGKK